MEQDKQIPRRMPLITYVLHPVKEYYYGCSKQTRRAIRNLAVILLFSASLCGFILSASICKFCFHNSYHYWWLVFPCCGLFYYLLDKSITFGESGTRLKKLRIVIAIVLGLFNSGLVNFYYFADDIRAARMTVMTHQQDSFRLQANRNDSVILCQRNLLIDSISRIRTRVSAIRKALNGEADGTDGSHEAGIRDIWNKKHDSYKADSISADLQIALLQQAIALCDSSKAHNAAELQSHFKDIALSSSEGINESMQQLHEIVWTRGNFTNKFMFILILLISLIFELIPLMAQHFYDTSQYFSRAHEERQFFDAQSTLYQTAKSQTAAAQTILQGKLDLAAMHSAYRLKEMDERLYFNRSILNREIEELDFLTAAEKRYPGKYPAYYDSHLKPVISKLYADLLDSANTAMKG